MANLSQIKRQQMLEFLQHLREEHKDDDDALIAIGEIETELNAKKSQNVPLRYKLPSGVYVADSGSR